MDQLSPLTFVSGLASERKKKFTSKVKSGCQTCRARRVKCDESKPTCSNCLRGARLCTYDQLVLSNRQHLRPSPLKLTHLQFQYGDGEDTRYLQLWTSTTASEISKYSDSYLWLNLIPQMGHSHKAIRKALVAVTAAREESTQSQNLSQSKAMLSYNEAINALTRDTKLPPSPDVFLICCILFWIFENLKDRPHVALTHLKAAFEILSDHKPQHGFQKQYIEPMLCENMSLTNTIIPEDKTHTADSYFAGLASLEPREYPRDIRECRNDFGRCQAAYVLTRKYFSGREISAKDLLPLCGVFQRWKDVFDRCASGWPVDQARLLSLNYNVQMIHVQEMVTDGIWAENDLRSREHLRGLLDEATYFTKREAVVGDNPLNISLIQVLTGIFQYCKLCDEDLAQEALSLLEEYPCFEGIWSSRVAANIAKKRRAGPANFSGLANLEAIFADATVEDRG